jgi:hypothetical protein
MCERFGLTAHRSFRRVTDCRIERSEAGLFVSGNSCLSDPPGDAFHCSIILKSYTDNSKFAFRSISAGLSIAESETTVNEEAKKERQSQLCN